MLSWNHKDIGNVFSLLIDLNKTIYGLESVDQTNIDKISGALNLFLKKLSPMIGDAVLINRHPYGMAEIREGGESISCSINGSNFDVSINDIQRIIRSMGMLRAEIVVERHCHFKVMGIQEDLETIFEEDGQILQGQDDPEYDKGEYADPGQKRTRISVLKSKGIVVSGEEHSLSTNQYQQISVEPLSPWAFIQLTGYFRDTGEVKPKFENVGKVHSLYHRSWTSLWELCTSIIVMFHAAFGDFSRLKICKTCGVLVYEKRIDRKDFCGKSCRVKYNQAGEPPEKYKCRMRQNAWINNQSAKITEHTTIFTVNKADCAKCATVQIKSGECALIREKNMATLSKVPARKKNNRTRRLDAGGNPAS